MVIVNAPLLPTEMIGEDESAQSVNVESERVKETKESVRSMSGRFAAVNEFMEILSRYTLLLEIERRGVLRDGSEDEEVKVHKLTVKESAEKT